MVWYWVFWVYRFYFYPHPAGQCSFTKSGCNIYNWSMGRLVINLKVVDMCWEERQMGSGGGWGMAPVGPEFGWRKKRAVALDSCQYYIQWPRDPFDSLFGVTAVDLTRQEAWGLLRDEKKWLSLESWICVDAWSYLFASSYTFLSSTYMFAIQIAIYVSQKKSGWVFDIPSDCSRFATERWLIVNTNCGRSWFDAFRARCGNSWDHLKSMKT